MFSQHLKHHYFPKLVEIFPCIYGETDVTKYILKCRKLKKEYVVNGTQ
jgi:hypothetical protein